MSNGDFTSDDLPVDGYDDQGLGGDFSDLPSISGKGAGKPLDSQRQVGQLMRPGFFHASCYDIKYRKPNDKDPAGQVTFEFKFECHRGILADGKPYEPGDTPGKQVVFVRQLNRDGEETGDFGHMAYALGLISREQLEDEGEEWEISPQEWKDAIGRQCVLQIVPNNQDKTKTNCWARGGTYNLLDKEVAHVPLNVDILKAAGYDEVIAALKARHGKKPPQAPAGLKKPAAPASKPQSGRVQPPAPKKPRSAADL